MASNKEYGAEQHEQYGGSDLGAPRKKRGFVDIMYPPGPNGGFKSRMINHYKKWWWLEFLIFAAIVLIITLPLIYVGFPHIAQSNINDSTLTVESQANTEPTPDKIHVDIVSNAHSDSMYHPTLDSFQAAFYLTDTLPNFIPFGYVTVPSTSAQKDTEIHINQVMTIANQEQFANYNKLVMNSKNFTVGFSGRVGLHQTALRKIDVDYNKTISMAGLNRLEGFNITSFQIKLTPEPDGANLIGNVYIPNPSVQTVELGNVTMNLSVDGTYIGYSLINNMLLKPGNNTLPMRSYTNQTTVLGLLGQTKYKSGILPISIVGNSSIYNGQHLPYFEAAIQSNTLLINMNIGQALGGL